MTRLLIVADMEGITGLERYEQCVRGHPEYSDGVQLLCDEVNVITDAAISAGAQTVSVIDWHGGGGNLDSDQLDERLTVVPEDLSPGFDLAFLVGFHPKAGDRTGFISHTMRQGLAVEVHGEQIGELSLLAWWLGVHDIPIGLITGDRGATAEADRLLPEVQTHTVKRSESWGRAECVDSTQSFEALRLKIHRVLEQRDRWAVFRPALPLKFKLKLRKENPLPGLLPWLDERADGWLAGELDHPRQLIDLIDSISGFINLGERNDFIAAIGEDPKIRKRMEAVRQQRTLQTLSTGHWNP
jgi:D-amino peptidase